MQPMVDAHVCHTRQALRFGVKRLDLDKSRSIEVVTIRGGGSTHFDSIEFSLKSRASVSGPFTVWGLCQSIPAVKFAGALA